MNDTSATDDKNLDTPHTALITVPTPPRDEDEHGDFAGFEHIPGHWSYELRRWLATLNPGRTGREYEKAVSYFFSTPGVPSELAALTFDLLLAYRGALALRAAPTERAGAYVARTPLSPATALNAPMRGVLPGPTDRDRATDAGDEGSDAEDIQASARPLAPATVNIRLTALRQFLVHCSLLGMLADLSADRIRMALKRLQIERRRPYQILAESEWEEFLAAAALPSKLRATPSQSGTSATPEPAAAESIMRRSPWGIPRAVRVSQAEAREAVSVSDAASEHTSPATSPATSSASLARSRAGLTGERTAQRDHALIALALATGLRAIELSLLDLGDLTREWHDGQEEWWLVLPDAKTKGQHGGRTLPLDPSLVAELFAYVRSTDRRLESPSDRSTPLFLSSRRSNGAQRSVSARTRLTPGQIGRIVDRVETQWVRNRDTSTGTGTGETRAISPHALRHSTAMALLQGSADGARLPASVEHVRGWLGHFDIRTTQGYLAHLDSRHHRRSLKIALPVDTSAQPGDRNETGQDDHGSGGAPDDRTTSSNH